MSVKNFDINPDLSKPGKQKRYEWYWLPLYCAAWFVLFYVAVIPSYYAYPETLRIREEAQHKDEFIGERAQMQLLGLSNIGVKLTGSVENEVYAVQFLMQEIEKIKVAARLDLYDIEVNVQHSSGQFMLWNMATSYDNVTNIIVKISTKSSSSNSSLLINSHFDSEVGSPAASDAGVMIVVMLETLRVISISERPLQHSVVFLLNGAEESNLLAAHGFISQHPWAFNCKAVINLDSAGAGGREILFQTGPNHPWLTKYYKKYAKHPYGNTIGEELFQNNFIPSDSDFRIFRDYGSLPGLDLAHTHNGYIYHTKYDNFINMERGTYQTTGDNILALTWAFANAPELENPKVHAEGHVVFYDYLGWFMISYSETAGIAINIVTCVVAFIAIGLAVHNISRREGAGTPKQVYLRFLMLFGAQLFTFIAALGGIIMVGAINHAAGISGYWYSSDYLVSEYFWSVFWVLGIFPCIFIYITRNKTTFLLNETIQCLMHSHCIILALICIVMTSMGIRSAYFAMIAVFFYTISVLLLMISKFFTKKDLFLPIHLACQLFPYWYYTYATYSFLKIFVPMQGRDGPDSKPEILISAFCAVMGILFSGFIIPIIHKFRQGSLCIGIIGAFSIVCTILASTSVGFPYRAEVSPQRFYVLHTNRIIHDAAQNIKKDDSGFYIQPVDKRAKTLESTTFINATPRSWIEGECATEVFCGLPLYNTRWMTWKESAIWIPSTKPVIPVATELKLLGTETLDEKSVRYNFSLRSSSHMVMYVDPQANCKVIDWSFDSTPLVENYPTPYFVYHVYSMVNDPLQFWIDVETATASQSGSKLSISVGAHFLYHTDAYTEDFKSFLKTFPDWAYPTNWISHHESWLF